MISSHISLRILPIHDGIKVNPCQLKEPQADHEIHAGLQNQTHNFDTHLKGPRFRANYRVNTYSIARHTLKTKAGQSECRDLLTHCIMFISRNRRISFCRIAHNGQYLAWLNEMIIATSCNIINMP